MDHETKTTRTVKFILGIKKVVFTKKISPQIIQFFFVYVIIDYRVEMVILLCKQQFLITFK